MLAIGRGDPTPLQPPRLHLDIVERQLLSVNVKAAYDRHGTSSSSVTMNVQRTRGRPSPRASELRRPPKAQRVKTRRPGPASPAATSGADACHLFCRAERALRQPDLVPLCVKSAVSSPLRVRRRLSPSRSFVRWGAPP